MGPIDYTMQVIDPIQAALQQRGLRFAEEQQIRAADQQDVALGQGQQRIDLAQQQFQAQQAEMARQRAQQEAARAQAEAGQQAFVKLMFDPNITADDVMGAMQANPSMAQPIMEYWQSRNEQQAESDLAFGKQIAFALGNAPDQAAALLERRAEAAENAGDAQTAAVMRSQAELIRSGEDGINAAKAQVLMTLAPRMDPKDLQTFMETAGLSQPEVKDEPDSVRALRIRAEEAGLQPGTPEYAQFMINGGAERGMVIESDGQGGFRMVQGVGAAGAAGKPFTEAQSKDVVYATRAKGALAALEPVAEALTGRLNRAAEMDPTGLTRGMQSDDFQVALNAGNEFLQAILRKDTGAAITAQEQALYGETYLPRPGDNEKLLKQKSEARKRAIAAIEAGMSPAQMVAQEKALQSGQQEGEKPSPASVNQKIAEAYRANGGRLTPEQLRKLLSPAEFEVLRDRLTEEEFKALVGQ